MLLNHTEEEIPDRKTSEAAKWLSDNNVQFDTPTFWLVAGLLNAYAAECVRVERERCAGIARKHGEGIGEHCWNHENLYVSEEIGAETTCWEEIATAIEREG